jgi:5,10-methylene-tetrahydrofolate dehydrogenase/methenyl tetrahydrofolate cyclohydrolase
MSKLKTVGVLISSLQIPQQSYEHLITFFNMHDDPSKTWDTFNNDKFELFGFLPKGFSFKNEKTVERIVSTFNEKPEAIAIMVFPPLFKQACPYFINKRILSIRETIHNLSDILLLVKKQDLEARQATEEIFIYEH